VSIEKDSSLEFSDSSSKISSYFFISSAKLKSDRGETIDEGIIDAFLVEKTVDICSFD